MGVVSLEEKQVRQYFEASSQDLELFHQELEALFRQDARVPQSLFDDWRTVGVLISSSFQSSIYPSDGVYFEEFDRLSRKLDILQRLAQLLGKIRHRYVEFLDDQAIGCLSDFTERIVGSVGFVKALKLLHFAETSRSNLKALKALRTAADSYKTFIQLLLPREYSSMYSGNTSSDQYKLFIDGSKVITSQIVGVSKQIASGVKKSQQDQAEGIRADIDELIRLIVAIINGVPSNFLKTPEGRAIQRVSSAPPIPSGDASDEEWDCWDRESGFSHVFSGVDEITLDVLEERLRERGAEA